MRLGRGALLAVVWAPLIAASCGDAGTSAAAGRVAELRARYPLLDRAPVAGVSRRARVTLPVRASGEVKLEDETSGILVRFALEHVRDSPLEVNGKIALYQGALDGADVVHRVHAEGTEDYVVFETRPAREELSYAVDVSRVPGLRLVSNTLEFLDRAGTPVLRVAPPWVVDAHGERHAAKLAVTGCAYDTSPAAPWGRDVTVPRADRCGVHVTWGSPALAYPAIVDPSWSGTGSMITPRAYHGASLLPSGKVLITGGTTGAGTAQSSAELYDPGGNAGAGTFAATGALSATRANHRSITLASGKVLVAGGTVASAASASAELYDPAGNGGAGSFVATGSMGTTRIYHTASMLPSGKVLVAGGLVGTASVASAEIFDPAANGGAGAFVATGAMASARRVHTASVLPSGKVLITGGFTTAALATAELFDPAGGGGVGAFGATGSMGVGRTAHTATVLSSGKVLVAGGSDGVTTRLKTAELYDPAGAGTFAPSGDMAGVRAEQTATLLPSGKVLIAGGFDSTRLTRAEVFDPAGAGTFAATGNSLDGHQYHTATLLLSGKVLIAAGYGPAGVALSEVYGGTVGEACAVNGYCLSGFCSDGVCCNVACGGGSCDRCDLAGTVGTCTVAPSGNAGSPTCGSFACDGKSAVCPTSCASDAACAPGSYCAAEATCKPQKAQAAECDAKTDCKDTATCRECASGFCVDGFCCNAACSGTCEACAASIHQGAAPNGMCTPIKDGADPGLECEASGVVCEQDGMCNGTRACRLATPAGVACSSDGKVCDGAGICALPPAATCDGDHTATGAGGKKQDCFPYKCVEDGTCRVNCTSVSDCAAPTICDAAGACVAPAPEAGATDEGCAVAAGPASESRSAWIAIAVGLGLLGRRARRRERGIER